MNRINRSTFFANIKSIFPNGFNGEVGKKRIEGIDTILDEWESRDDITANQLAYIFATAIWETGYTVQPIKEGGGEAYLKTKKYYPWYGRGYVQLTWEKNYKFAGDKIGVNLIADKNKALNPDVAIKVLFEGMRDGWFTGKKLSNYIVGNSYDYVEARRIINGVDKKNEIAAIALKVKKALDKSEVANSYPLKSSRTIQGAAITGAAGTVNLVSEVNNIVQATEAHQEAFTSGNVISIIIGVVAVLGAVYALYARWDDAGRPVFWRK